MLAMMPALGERPAISEGQESRWQIASAIKNATMNRVFLQLRYASYA
jgi:hypothetical protein